MNVPSEFTIGGVYAPPMLIAAFLGSLAAATTVMLLNRYRLSRYFLFPPIVFIAFAIIFTFVVGKLLIPF